MEKVLCEPVELTEFELDAVAGGNPFSINIAAVASAISATETLLSSMDPPTALQIWSTTASTFPGREETLVEIQL